VSAEPEYHPRLNHVAITMDPAALDDTGRAEILDFYGDVFGWTEGDNTGERGNPLILYTGEFGQFIFLLPADGASTGNNVDHFGLQVSTCGEIEDIVDRAKKRQASDDRVSITDIHSRTTRGPVHEYTLTSAYIGFKLPLTIELQNITRRES
jgi:catechol 2,3-dioxygenase-like lactoylglutathione lyase family enzyme